MSHLDPAGRARMVDVGGKDVSERRAVAEGFLAIAEATADALFAGELPKGDALAVARVAAIQAAKRTSDLIPLCHLLGLTSVEVDIERDVVGARVEARVTTTDRTGVEMEALTAVAVGALTLYDMVKSMERGAEVGPIRLVAKSGGASGDWSR